MMTSQKICFIIITLGSRQEQEIMWAEDVLKKRHFFFKKLLITYSTAFRVELILPLLKPILPIVQYWRDPSGLGDVVSVLTTNKGR